MKAKSILKNFDTSKSYLLSPIKIDFSSPLNPEKISSSISILFFGLPKIPLLNK